MRNRDEQKQVRIHRAALELINQEGLQGASMAKIARRADVSPATIYLYFDHKDDMINKLYLGFCRELGQRLTEGLTQCDGQCCDSLGTVYRVFYDFATEDGERFRFLEQFANNPRVDKMSQAESKTYFASLYGLYEQLRQRKQIKPLPDEVISAHLFFPLIHLIKLSLIDEIELTCDILEQSFKASLDAIRLP